MTSYTEELAGLATAYERARAADLDADLRAAHLRLHSSQLVVVASGGAVPVAELAAALHTRTTGRLAAVMTPLRFVEAVAEGLRSGVLLFSSRARHPDTEAAARSALRAELPIVLVTERAAHDLTGALADPAVSIVTVPRPDPPDGFLATGSVVMMAAVALRLFSVSLPERLPVAESQSLSGLRSRVLVLHSSDGRPAALDIETRLHELGLADVQVADYRNFAHGRHVGLARRRAQTTIIALTSLSFRTLAEETVRTLDTDTDTDVRWVTSEESGPIAQLALLTAVMVLPTALAAQQRLEPSRPPVEASGRRLYHLPIKRILKGSATGPIERKLVAAGWQATDPEARVIFQNAYRDWSREVRTQVVDALLLDYDGTCVATASRYDLPSTDVQRSLIDLLSEGMPLIFASGRGDSLYKDLRAWLPDTYWGLVELALHNGGWKQRLSDPLLAPAAVDPSWGDELCDLLGSFTATGLLMVRRGATQITVTSGRADPDIGKLAVLVRSLVAQSTAGLRVASSGHSVDVVPRGTGKDHVLRGVQAEHGAVLAVGDQGQEGGNDFHMLAATSMSVSVDRCSADPSRCWNVARGGRSGPLALVETLARLRKRRGRLRLDLPVVEDELR